MVGLRPQSPCSAHVCGQLAWQEAGWPRENTQSLIWRSPQSASVRTCVWEQRWRNSKNHSKSRTSVVPGRTWELHEEPWQTAGDSQEVGPGMFGTVGKGLGHSRECWRMNRTLKVRMGGEAIRMNGRCTRERRRGRAGSSRGDDTECSLKATWF